MSAGVPEPRERDLRRERGALLRRSSAAVMSVSMKPGAIAFTRMLRLASSFATDFVRPISPALLAA